jgi:hypothetical protein
VAARAGERQVRAQVQPDQERQRMRWPLCRQQRRRGQVVRHDARDSPEHSLPHAAEVRDERRRAVPAARQRSQCDGEQEEARQHAGRHVRAQPTEPDRDEADREHRQRSVVQGEHQHGRDRGDQKAEPEHEAGQRLAPAALAGRPVDEREERDRDRNHHQPGQHHRPRERRARQRLVRQDDQVRQVRAREQQ